MQLQEIVVLYCKDTIYIEGLVLIFITSFILYNFGVFLSILFHLLIKFHCSFVMMVSIP